MAKPKKFPLSTKVYSPVEWEKRRKRQKRAASKRKRAKATGGRVTDAETQPDKAEGRS